MNPEQESFDQLRQLLKLKRYEQPPPRYFNDFSSQVLGRIETSTKADRPTFAESLYVEAPWLQRLFGVFHSKRAFAWAGGLAACALMVSGIVYSESPGPSPQVAMDVPNHAINEQDMSAPLMELGQTPAERLVSSPASTDPLMQPAARSAFDFVQPVATQPVALTNF